MNLYDRLERITRRWWFYLTIFCIQFLPPYTTRGTTDFNSQEINRLAGDVLSRAFVLSWVNLSPLFKFLPLILLVLLVYVPGSRPFLASLPPSTTWYSPFSRTQLSWKTGVWLCSRTTW